MIHARIKSMEDLERNFEDAEIRPTQLGPAPVQGQVMLADLGVGMLKLSRWKGEVRMRGPFSATDVAIGICLDCHGGRLCGRSIERGAILVCPPGYEHEGTYNAGISHLLLLLSQHSFQGAAARAGMSLHPDAFTEPWCFLPPPELRKALVTKGRRLQDAMFAHSGTAVTPAERDAFADELMDLFLCALAPADLAEVRRQSPFRTCDRIVSTAEDWLLAQPGDRLSVDRMAVDLNVSRRTLYRAFKAEIGISPARFIKLSRLSRIRRRLVRAEPDAAIGKIASAEGIWDHGRFAADYARLFGELPSATLARSQTRRLAA